MTKVIDIQQLKVDIIAECAKSDVQIPNGAMDDIIQMHSVYAPAYNQLKFSVGLFDSSIDFVVNVDKMLKRTSIVGKIASKLSPEVYGLIEHKFVEKETVVFEPSNDTFGDRIKNMYGNVRFNMLLNRLKTASTPMEAFQLLVQYLEEDTEISGVLKRKESVVEYSFSYNKDIRQVAAKLAIFNRESRMTPIMDVELNLDDKNIEIFYQSVISLMNLVK